MHYWLQTLKAWSQRRNGLNSTQLAVELSWVLKSDHIASGDVITLDAQPMLRIAELVTTGSNELRWVTGCDHSARSDSTQPVELSWVESGRALRSELRLDQMAPVHVSTSTANISTIAFSVATRPTFRKTQLNARSNDFLALDNEQQNLWDVLGH